MAAGAKVDAVEVAGEDGVLRIVGLNAQGQGDFKKFPVQRLGPDVKGIAGQLHA